MEHVTFEELYDAYVECRRHKRKSECCSRFEMARFANLQLLLDELNDCTYEIGYSICFVVTRPKLREVYAADFRDRIVHHLLIRKFNSLFEDWFIPSTYNCRKGKGVMYGVMDMEKKILSVTENGTKEAWIWKADLKNFFMTINKRNLYLMLRSFLRARYKGDDLEWWLWLTEKVVMHEPQKKRIVKGDPKLLDKLEYGKKLGDKDGCGVAIGNLPSQIFANFLLSILDYYLYYYREIEYGRYVDDFVGMSRNKELLLWLMSSVREYVEKWCGVELHRNKWQLQQARKGVKFTGYVVRIGRVYSGNRTVDNAFMVASRGEDGNLARFVSRMNSYLGFLSHTSSYAIRRRIWNAVPVETQRKIYITNRFTKIVIRKNYECGYQKIVGELRTDYGYRGWTLLFERQDARGGGRGNCS